MTHRATHHSIAGSHWCTCTCGWRSTVRSTRTDVETDHRHHVEEES